MLPTPHQHNVLIFANLISARWHLLILICISVLMHMVSCLKLLIFVFPFCILPFLFFYSIFYLFVFLVAFQQGLDFTNLQKALYIGRNSSSLYFMYCEMHLYNGSFIFFLCDTLPCRYFLKIKPLLNLLYGFRIFVRKFSPDSKLVNHSLMFFSLF